MNDRPWMTALEMQFAALHRIELVKTGAEYAGLDARDRKVLLAESVILRRSPAYSWSFETTTAALLASQTIPLDTPLTRENLPTDMAGFWWFGRPATSVETPGAGLRDIVGMAWGTTGDLSATAIMIVGFVLDDYGRPVSTITAVWRFGETVRAMMDRNNADNNAQHLSEVPASVPSLCRLFLAGHAWLNQRILLVSSGHIERHRRKQLARENGPTVSDVKVIQLRRAESQHNKDGRTSESVEWTCRWIVNGHWRNQPYSNGEHKLIYILPYVKGPDDKPLKVPAHTVYAVNR